MLGLVTFLVAALIAVAGLGAIASGISDEMDRRKTSFRAEPPRRSHPAGADALSDELGDDGVGLMAEIEDWLKQQQ